MSFRRETGILLLACAAAVGVCGVAPPGARGALAQAQGQSGYSGTLSSNAGIRKQQLICDPDPPDVGSTSVSYNPAISYLGGIADGPGYGPPSSGPGGYIQVFDRTMDMFRLVDLGQYLNNLDEFGRDFVRTEMGLEETGYVQVFFARSGQPGQLSIAEGYNLVDQDHGATGALGVDTFALFFDAADPSDPSAVAQYTVFGSGADQFSGNAADFMQVLGPNGYTVAASQIAPATVQGPFVPEPAALGLLGLAGAGLLARRRRGA